MTRWRFEFEDINARTIAAGVLLGVTKASLSTSSSLPRPPFRRPLASSPRPRSCQKDRLLGLKQNVIIGKLIPAGTGLQSRRDQLEWMPKPKALAAMCEVIRCGVYLKNDAGFQNVAVSIASFVMMRGTRFGHRAPRKRTMSCTFHIHGRSRLHGAAHGEIPKRKAGRMMRTLFGAVLTTALIVVSACGAATQGPSATQSAGTQAQPKYPTRPVTLVLGFGAGSSSDQAARALAESSHKHLGQPIVVQNVPGAGSATAANQIAKAQPDGYNILFTAFGIVTLPHLEPVPFKPLEDFIPVIQVGGFPLLFLVRADSPFKTLKDFANYAKQNPGKANHATSGVGTSTDLAGLLFAKSGDFQLTAVPFASAQGIAALLGGTADSTFNVPSASIQYIQEGKLRALGITSAERHKALPDVPTFKEQGFDVQLFGWWALAVPKGTPDYAVNTIHDAVKKGLADDPYKSMMDKALQPIDYLGPADTMAKWRAEYQLFGDLLKNAKR